jgi:hypothetical protein
MAAYLIADVDDLIAHFAKRRLHVDLQELAVGLRADAQFAAGLMRKEQLKAVAAARWDAQPQAPGTPDLRAIFRGAGYDLFEIPDGQQNTLADALIAHYFADGSEPVNELILVTTNADLVSLAWRVKTTRTARIRMWGAENLLSETELAENVIFQPLETLLGIQQTKNVAIYIDFENIAISLNDQGYTVNLDELISSIQHRAQMHGSIVKINAYAPWGQRGSLPPMVDGSGREVTEEAQSRLAMASIDPVFNLPGKNSADMRISRDIMMDSSYPDAADVYIIASGDRDFGEAMKLLRQRNKTVIVWSVRGTISRMLSDMPGVQVEYIEDFANLQTHQAMSLRQMEIDEQGDVIGFTPSMWSSVVLQIDRMAAEGAARTSARSDAKTASFTRKQIIDQLVDVGAVPARPRGEDLVSQAEGMGILQRTGNNRLSLDPNHPTVEKTRLIRDRIVTRVNNTLQVRDWEYVNYGFLLKGLAMDRDLERAGMNYSDQWRSDWIDCLVREKVLVRELVPHRHNPEDLVPVIKLPSDYQPAAPAVEAAPTAPEPTEVWRGMGIEVLEQREPETAAMVRRVVVSVEQFTSFRGFTWCPLGSLHKRLRGFDRAMSFQRAVEYLGENEAAAVSEYSNPQSEFLTKGISLNTASSICRDILEERDEFVRLLLILYEKNSAISETTLRAADPGRAWDLALWFSIMETENILNTVPGRPGQYSLFRTHHTVTLVADALGSG